jgi:hypothetical protein
MYRSVKLNTINVKLDILSKKFMRLSISVVFLFLLMINMPYTFSYTHSNFF